MWQPLLETVRRWQRDDGPLLAAAIAYYLTLSLIPLLLVLISGLGTLAEYTHYGSGVKDQVLDGISRQVSAAFAEHVQTAFGKIEEGASAGGPIGLITLLLAALVIFAQFERAFDRIWDIPHPTGGGLTGLVKNLLVKRLRAFLMLLGIGLFVVVVFITGIILSSVHAYAGDRLPGGERIWWWVQLGTSLVLNAAAFTIVYKVLPKVPIRWCEAARGAVVVAATWEVGRQVLAGVVIGARHTSAYGVVGALLAIMLWAYYAATVLFLGAEYIQTYCARCDHEQEVSI